MIARADSQELDHEAFTAAVGAHYTRLVRRLTLIVHDPDEAEDLAQTTLEQAYKAWPNLRDDIGGWLFTVGTRLALNELRRRRRIFRWRASADVDRMAEQAGDPELWEALGELSRHERAALILSVIEGYTQAEIAQQLGVPPGTVASWLSRAKARLRTKLEVQ